MAQVRHVTKSSKSAHRTVGSNCSDYGMRLTFAYGPLNASKWTKYLRRSKVPSVFLQLDLYQFWHAKEKLIDRTKTLEKKPGLRHFGFSQ